MFTLKKIPDRDFLVLNISDPQLGDNEWEEGSKEKSILEYTVKTLVEKTSPDLITVSGEDRKSVV